MHKVLIAWSFVTAASPAFAAGCDEYPFSQGINVEDVNGGTKIISTSVVSVSFDDVDSLKDARDEAILEAKSQIARFMAEGVKSEQEINKAVNETKSMQGESKSSVRNEVIVRLKRMGSSAQAMLRGVVPLGECYTRGEEMRVSVGIKPETINSAGSLADGIGGISHGPAPTTSPMNKREPGGLSGVNSYSNTKQLDKF